MNQIFRHRTTIVVNEVTTVDRQERVIGEPDRIEMTAVISVVLVVLIMVDNVRLMVLFMDDSNGTLRAKTIDAIAIFEPKAENHMRTSD